MAVKKSFVSALPVHVAAAPPPAREPGLAEGFFAVAALDGEGLRAVAVRAGLGTVAGSVASAVEALSEDVAVDPAGARRGSQAGDEENGRAQDVTTPGARSYHRVRLAAARRQGQSTRVAR